MLKYNTKKNKKINNKLYKRVKSEKNIDSSNLTDSVNSGISSTLNPTTQLMLKP